MRRTALAALLLLAASASAVRAQSLPSAVGMLPIESKMLVGLNLKSLNNPKSLLSIVPRADIDQIIAQESKKAGPAASDAGDAIARVAFASPIASRVSVFAMGNTGTDPEAGTSYAVILGQFTAKEAFDGLKTLGVGAGPDSKTGSFPMAAGAPKVFVHVPADNMVLVSTDGAWFSKAAELGKTKTGLLAPTSLFNSTVTTFGGRSPDALLWFDAAILSGATEGNPMIAMMVGPVLKANGMAAAIFPGDKPAAEFHARYADPASAGAAKDTINQLFAIQKQQIEAMLGSVQDAKQKAQLQEAITTMKDIGVSVVQNSAVVKYDFAKMPDKEAFRKQLLAWIQAGISGQIPQPGM